MKKLLEEYKRLHPRCEACGNQCGGDPHHLKTRGAGGTDDHSNLLRLCGYCHRLWDDVGPVCFMRLFPHLQEKVLAIHSKLREQLNRVGGAFQY
jgi:hypothetical protein